MCIDAGRASAKNIALVHAHAPVVGLEHRFSMSTREKYIFQQTMLLSVLLPVDANAAASVLPPLPLICCSEAH